MQRIILFYKFTVISDPQTVLFWQRELAEACGLKGRLIIAPHGINGTLGGPIDGLKRYIKQTKLHPSFKGIVFKWSEGGDTDFPRLSVKVRDELVAFKAGKELKVNKNGVIGGGKKLKPQQLHNLIKQKGDEVVFFDGRNPYEAAIGKFKGAVVPTRVKTSRDFIHELEDSKYEQLKDKPIVTYCTGGIRCEVLSMLMKNRGFKEVYQLDGGIVKYGEQFADDGFWQGKLHVFDGRMATAFSDKAEDIGLCSECGSPTSRYINCANQACNQLILMCESCRQQKFCSSSCTRDVKLDQAKVG